MTEPDAPVLIVEDDADIRALLRRRVERLGRAVVEAATGEEAVELAARRPPALVMLDIRLPGIDGWAVLTQLRRDPVLADIPVLVVSIVDDAGDGHPPVQGYMVKPFHTTELDAVVGRLLAGEPVVDEKGTQR